MDTNTPGDENVERLIEEAYRPEPIDLRFAERTLKKLQELADERKEGHLPWRQLTWLYFANAAAVLLLIAVPPLFWRVFIDQPQREQAAKEKEAPRPSDHLTPRPREEAKALPMMEIGQTLTTATGEKRRVQLPDDTVVSLNQTSSIRLDAARQFTLLHGEVFVEVATARKKTPYVIVTPKREVKALGTKLALQTNDQGTSVLVTQGQVKISGIAGVVGAGQMVEAESDRATNAQRVSHTLEWTRDLLTEEILVPPSDFRGGALVAKGLDGETLRLSLRKYRVDVHIEDGFARTTIDQTYFNHTHGRLEGTFHFPLPADASLSRLAMYVEGTRMEGGMVEREHGRTVYESIVRSMQDPALLEWVDGTTFKMRVFPLEPRQEKRIILSYSQRLPVLYGKTLYRFPAGHSLEEVGSWSFHARVKQGEKLAWKCPSHDLTARKVEGDVVLTAEASRVKVDRDIVLELKDPAYTGGEKASFSTTDFDGERFLMLRYRPEWPATLEKRTRRDWLILFEASGDRDPLLARTQIEIVRTLLRNVEHDDTFSILTANTRTHWIEAKPQPATKANVEKALTALEQVHLIGGFDLAAALTEASGKLRTMDHPHLVHVGSGYARLGERRHNKLLELLPDRARYIGIGVGKRWDRAYLKAAAEKTSGLFAQINPDEPIAWRTFDLLATLNTPRLLNVCLSEKDVPRFVTDTTQVFQGEEWCAAARLHKDTPLPDKLVLMATLDGKPFQREIAVKDLATKADYIPRTWARWQIDQLVAESPRGNKDGIIALSKRMYVMSPFTSLLVLENDAMYERFKVDRGRKDHWASYDCPDKIPVIVEPMDGTPRPVQPGQGGQIVVGKPTVEQVQRSILVRRMSGWSKDEPNTLGEYLPLGEMRIRRLSSLNLQVIDAEIPLNYDVTRIEEVSVSGRVDPEQTIGIPGATDVPPIVIPPPPGSGRNSEAAVDVKAIDTSLTRFDSASGQLVYDPGDDRLPADLIGTSIVVHERLHVQKLMKMQEKIIGHRDLGLARVFFRDLTLHAPGFHTTRADVMSVLEAETVSGQPVARGNIDDRSRKLIEKARTLGWRRVDVAESPWQEAHSIVFDGMGRYRCDRIIAPGMKESVVCDGKTILHLYPDIGLGTKRPLSRFHRAEFTDRIPEAIPPVEDLTMGADVMSLDETTIAIVPHRGKTQTELVFEKDGRLVEKRLVEKATRKLIRKATMEARAGVAAPDLAPDLRSLVVLPMPLRSRESVASRYPETQNKMLRDLNDEEALAVLAANFAERTGSLEDLIKARFLDRGDKRIGLLTLLVAANPWRESRLDGRSFEGPLAEYLNRFGGKDKKGMEKKIEQPRPMTFVERMTELHELLDYLSNNFLLGKDQSEANFNLLRSCRSPLLLWALGQEYAAALDSRERHHESRQQMIVAMLEELSKLLRDIPEVGYSMRYEHVRGLQVFGHTEEAKKAFRDLYDDTLLSGRLPVIHASFRDALGREEWRRLMLHSAEFFLKRKEPRNVLVLASQAQRLGDEGLSDDLIEKVLASDEGGPQSALEAIAFLCRENRLDRAEVLATKLSSKKDLAVEPKVWRMAARVAEMRYGRATKTIALLERALDLEWHRQPRNIHPHDARNDYLILFTHYDRLTRAVRELDQSPSPELVEKVLRSMERWRALDPQGVALKKGVEVLLALNEREAAWDYLTTLVAKEEPNTTSWRERGITYREERQYEMAERCLKEAQASDPESASTVMERAKLLNEMGRRKEARVLLNRIVQEKWSSQYDEVREEARRMLGER